MKALGGMVSAVLLAAASAAGGELSALSSALVTFENPVGWSAGVGMQTDRRSYSIAEEDEAMDRLHLRATLGYRLLPFLHFSGSAGWVRTDRTGESSRAGYEWGLGAETRLAEYVLRRSHSTPGLESLQLALRGEFLAGESTVAEEDFEWREMRVIPTISYHRQREGEVRLHYNDYTGLAMHAGLVFFDFKGDIGPDKVRYDRDFGLLLGVDWRWHKGWVTRVHGILFGGSDREWGIATAYFF